MYFDVFHRLTTRDQKRNGPYPEHPINGLARVDGYNLGYSSGGVCTCWNLDWSQP
jgi:hypothetical protein